MFDWLSTLGITLSNFGDNGYMIYALVCSIAVLMISSIVSVLFGVVVGIFHK